MGSQLQTATIMLSTEQKELPKIKCWKYCSVKAMT